MFIKIQHIVPRERKSMSDKFTLYDLLGFIVPGFMTVWAGNILLEDLLGIQLLGFSSEVVDSTAFVLLAYFTGHLLQGLGNIIETQMVEREWHGYFSTRYLKAEDKHYTDGFKAALKKAAAEVFSLDLHKEGLTDSDIKEFFDLAYSTIVQKGVAKHAEIFNGTYGLYRGLLSSCVVNEIIFSGLMLASALHFGNRSHLLPFYVTTSLFFAVASIFFKRRFTRFGKRFADSVYRSFYVLYHTNKLRGVDAKC